jgi:hypothetical protein
MVETSYFWGGTTIGDHGTYTDDNFSDFITNIFLKDRTLEGVLPFVGAFLVPTNPSGVTIRIAAGSALVDGKLYTSSANVDHTVAAPGAGFNYYSVVLTKDFAAQTVRQTLLGPSTVGYPTVTQTDGTKWEIYLAKISVSSAGVIVVTDSRTLCHVNSMVSEAMIEAGAVTNTKIGALAVDNAKIANATITNAKLATPNPVDGWVPDTGWSYASATTINVPSGAASRYSLGDPFKLTSNSVVLQGNIVKIADTLLTIRGDTLTNFVYSSIYYSHMDHPVGFPQWFVFTCTGPTNATIVARFRIFGLHCHFKAHIYFTGAPDFTNMPTLPIKAASAIPSQDWYSLCASYGDAGVRRIGKLCVFTPSGGSDLASLTDGDKPVVTDTMLNPVTPTVPITWANGDRILIDWIYEWMTP